METEALAQRLSLHGTGDVDPGHKVTWLEVSRSGGTLLECKWESGFCLHELFWAGFSTSAPLEYSA